MSKGHKIKIIIIIHSLQSGGMERVASELSNKFSESEELDVHIILYGIKRVIFYNLSNKVKIHKPNFKFDNTYRFFSTLKTISFLRKKIKKLKPDTVLSFGEYWNNLVLLATYGLKVPLYVADRSEPMKDLGIAQNFLRKKLYPSATALIVQTQKAKEIYQEQFKNLNIEVIGNPIKKIQDTENKEKENIILMIGRLITTKHQDRLINIFSKINNPEWKLLLVGDNAKKQKNIEKLAKLIRDLNMEDHIVLTGQQKKVENYYLKSKIFAFTSSSEGFPNVIGEAMSAGLPVVAYDCMVGPSEMIEDLQNGFLIPLFDDKMFQEKLEKLMNNEKLRKIMGNRGKEYIKRFDSNKCANEFLNVILKNTRKD